MKTHRITIKRLAPNPEQLFSLRGITRYAYRIRRDGEVIRSGITEDPARPETLIKQTDHPV